LETDAKIKNGNSHAGATYWPAWDICWHMGQLIGSLFRGYLSCSGDPFAFKAMFVGVPVSLWKWVWVAYPWTNKANAIKPAKNNRPPDGRLARPFLETTSIMDHTKMHFANYIKP
jgi:hypothetical protein